MRHLSPCGALVRQTRAARVSCVEPSTQPPASAALGVLALIVVAVVLTVAALLILAVIGSTLGGIYRAAIYRYAATGQVSGGFSSQLVQGAFSSRQSSPQAANPFSDGFRTEL